MSPLQISPLRSERRVLGARNNFKDGYSAGPSFHAQIDFNLGNRHWERQPSPAYSLVPNGDYDWDDSHEAFLEEMRNRRPSCCQRWRNGDFIVMPENNRFLDIWDIIVITALLLTALVVPFEAALFEKSIPLFDYMSKCTDVVFSIDIVLTFNVAIPITSATSKDFYEKSPIKIAQYYMAFPFTDKFKAGWFWPDLVTVFPWEQLSNFLRKGKRYDELAEEELVNEVRLVRILRLVRMFRLVRVVKLVKRWRSQTGFSSASADVIKCFLCTGLALHVLACAWCWLGVNVEPSWLEIHAQGNGLKKEDYTKFQVYNCALYFCTMVLTTVGLGDILPQSQIEISMGTITMFFTGILWAWVLASIVNIITNSDMFGSHYNALTDDLNSLMDARGVSPHLRIRLRKYLDEAEHVHRQRHQRQSLKSVTRGLQGELAVEAGVSEVCQAVWYLRKTPPHVLTDLAQYFLPDMFCPGEFVNEETSLMVVRRGTCIQKGKILIKDAVIGEDMILVSQWLREIWFPRALSFVEVMSLNRNDLLKVCARHTDFSRGIRRAQIKLAIWRGFIHASKVAREEVRKNRLMKPTWSRQLSLIQNPGLAASPTNIRHREPGTAQPTLLHSGTGQLSASSGASGASAPHTPHLVGPQFETSFQDTPAARMEPTSPARGVGGGTAEILFEIRALGTRIEESSASLKRHLEKLDARISGLESKSARLRQCRQM